MTYRNYSIDECAATLEKILKERPGSAFYQKWTCGGCGQRIIGNERNKLFIEGHCEDCGHVTDLRKAGCNYALHMAFGGVAEMPPKGSA